ncbi:TPA: hypothetical protein SMF89_004580 [Serratia marcescens]|nr:hypothetical protein [Serratia marcescens]
MKNQTEEQRRIAALEEEVAALKSQFAQVNSLQSASEAGKLSATCYIKVNQSVVASH